MKIKERLKKLIKEGYVLHGAVHKQKTLRPTKQFDYKKKVLCFTNIPEVAFFHAVTSHKRAGKTADSRYDLESMKFYATKSVLKTMKKGYIYAVKKEKIRKSKKRGRDWEWISYLPLKPQKVIIVSPRDFKLKIKMIQKSFNERCYAVLRKVPRGRVTTYKEIAKALHSKAYRAVGNAMHNNPYAPEVPCHRVIKSDGTIGGFFSGTNRKIRMLKAEGIEIKNNKVNLKKYFFKLK